MKFHLVSLGCDKNTFDSEGIVGHFLKRGWKWTENPESADLIFINTCGFIKEAKEESLKRIMDLLALKKSRPTLKIVAFGCLVKRYFQEIKKDIPELDHLFDFATPSQLEILEKTFAPKNGKKLPLIQRPVTRKMTPTHFAFLKIAEGCDNYCSYCAIPKIRGPFSSRKLDTILAEANASVETGARELIIVAQDSARYGTDDKKSHSLGHLLRKISALKDLHWIRLQYLHPKRLSPTFIDEIFSIPKVLPYFDIPFQHVSDRMLNLMNRQVSKKDLVSLIGHIRKSFPKAILRTTFIVGFPGENEEDFELLTDFIQLHRIDRLGAFAYSPEENTSAIKVTPKVPQKTKIRRLDELMTLQQTLAQDYNQKWVGKKLEILIDRIEGRKAFGRSYGDAPDVDNSVTLRYDSSFKIGDFVQVKIQSAEAYDLFGEKIA